MSGKSVNLVAALLVAVGLAGVSGRATAEDPATTERRERCAMRLSMAFLGESPSSTDLANLDPSAPVAAYVKDPRFQERFARFLNAKFNPRPGVVFGSEDAPYFLGKWVLESGLPYRELFVGDNTVEHRDPHDAYVTKELSFQTDFNVGYFTSYWWKVRYAGNERDGYALQMAHRILNNVLGVHLVAVTNAPSVDLSAKGREAPGCRGCHFDGPYPLDKIARLLPRRAPPTPPYPSFDNSVAREPQVLWGKTLNDERDLVKALVDSDQFKFNACRLAFEFLYARPESPCESELFDRCYESFSKSGLIQDALVTVATDPTYCE